MNKAQLKFTCGFNNESGKREVIRLTDGSSIEEIKSALKKMEKKVDAAATLAFEPEPDVGPALLRVISDGEKYLLTFLEYGQDRDVIVRTRNDPLMPKILVPFEGERYPASAVVQDIDFVIKVFSEFFESGNISYDIMK